MDEPRVGRAFRSRRGAAKLTKWLMHHRFEGAYDFLFPLLMKPVERRKQTWHRHPPFGVMGMRDAP